MKIPTDLFMSSDLEHLSLSIFHVLTMKELTRFNASVACSLGALMQMLSGSTC